MATEWLTVEHVCAELGVTRQTWNKWRARRVGPPAKRLPNGTLRISRNQLDTWREDLEDAA